MPRSIALFVTMVLLSACGGEPLEYTETDEIREGPGLLTGERGAIVITPSGIENLN